MPPGSAGAVEAQVALPRVAATRPHVPVGHSVVRGALSLLSTQPLTWGATMLGTVADPRLLTAGELGQITVAITICNIASTVAGLGITEYLVRRVAQQPDNMRRDAGLALTVGLVTSGLGLLAVAVLGQLFWSSIVGYPLLLVAQIPMLAAPARTVLLSCFRGRERHRDYAWLNAACLVTVTLSGFFILLAGFGLFLSTVGCGIAVLGVTALGWRLSGIRPHLPALDRAALAGAVEFIRAGLPFMSWQLTQLAYSQIDRILMGTMVSVSELGWYASANRIIAIPIFIPTLIVTPLFPALSRSAHEPRAIRRSVEESLRFVLLLTVPLCAGIIAVAPAIPPLLGWPADFDNTVLPMRILSLQLPLAASGMVLGTMLMAIGREKRFVLVALTATVFNVAANLAAIPVFEALTGNGGIGASVVTDASEVLMLVGALVLVPRHLVDPRIVFVAARIGFAGLATAFVGATLLPIGLFASIPAGAATYVVAAFALRVVNVDDLRVLSARLGRR